MMLDISAPLARDQLSSALITCCAASEVLAGSAFARMLFHWPRTAASRWIKRFPSVTFALQFLDLRRARRPQIGQRVENQAVADEQRRHDGGEHDQKLLAVFNFHCAPPFPYLKSNVNCIGALP